MQMPSDAVVMNRWAIKWTDDDIINTRKRGGKHAGVYLTHLNTRMLRLLDERKALTGNVSRRKSMKRRMQ